MSDQKRSEEKTRSNNIEFGHKYCNTLLHNSGVCVCVICLFISIWSFAFLFHYVTHATRPVCLVLANSNWLTPMSVACVWMCIKRGIFISYVMSTLMRRNSEVCEAYVNLEYIN